MSQVLDDLERETDDIQLALQDPDLKRNVMHTGAVLYTGLCSYWYTSRFAGLTLRRISSGRGYCKHFLNVRAVTNLRECRLHLRCELSFLQ